MNTPRALLVFRLVFVGFIAFASVQALYSAATIAASAHLASSHVYVLASTELIAALALLSRRTEWMAATVLVLVFAVAAVLDSRAGDIPVRYAYYAATAIFIVYLSTKRSSSPVVDARSAARTGDS